MFLDDAAHGFLTGLLRRATLAHQLDDEETPGVADHFFADAGGCRATDIAIDIQARTDDGTVTDTTAKLPRHAAGGTGARHLATLVERQHADRIVVVLAAGQRVSILEVLTIDARFV